MAEVTTLLGALVTEALNQAKADGLLEGEVPEANFERPRRKDHGDWATNVALVASAGGNPRSLADAIVDRLPASDIVRSVEVAGPGFLNFHLSPKWLHDIVTPCRNRWLWVRALEHRQRGEGERRVRLGEPHRTGERRLLPSSGGRGCDLESPRSDRSHRDA